MGIRSKQNVAKPARTPARRPARRSVRKICSESIVPIGDSNPFDIRFLIMYLTVFDRSRTFSVLLNVQSISVDATRRLII